MHRTTLFFAFCLAAGTFSAQSPAEKAAEHLLYWCNRYHNTTYVYADGGAKIFTPSGIGGSQVDIDERWCDNPFQPPHCLRTKLTFNASAWSSMRCTFPPDNGGDAPGFDVSVPDGDTVALSFWVRGSGWAEFTVGGVNKRPFHDGSKPYEDGVDLRSTGFMNLTGEWQKVSTPWHDNRFWVFQGPLAGANNKFPAYEFTGTTSAFHFRYRDTDPESQEDCMSLQWMGTAAEVGGVVFFPPGGGWNTNNGYNLTGLEKIRLKVRSTVAGNFKAGIGISGLEHTFTSTNQWQWVEWDIPTINPALLANVTRGFSITAGGAMGTPPGTLYLDSVYYTGVELAHDWQHLIGGFSVSAFSDMNNGQPVEVFLDEVSYNKSRLEHPRLLQSFANACAWYDPYTAYQAYLYDNDLSICALLAMYRQSNDSTCLQAAKLIGKGIRQMMLQDRYFPPGAGWLRNAGPAGELLDGTGHTAVPGFWLNGHWYADAEAVSVTTGNVAWASLALLNLYKVTGEADWLTGARELADWCIEHVQTPTGFTGGYTGWAPNPVKYPWSSSEHNLDLYPVFTRLFQLTGAPQYAAAANIAAGFMDAMWNAGDGHFYTGTNADGTVNNAPEYQVLDIQPWYVLAFRPNASSQYLRGLDWARAHCFMPGYQSAHFPGISMPVYDFDTALDGAWPEGTCFTALAERMRGHTAFADSLREVLRYIQQYDPSGNGLGLPAAVGDSVATPFESVYWHRSHIAPTAWMILQELCVNPYWFDDACMLPVVTNEAPGLVERPIKLTVVPNPVSDAGTVLVELPSPSPCITLELWDITGQFIHSQTFTDMAAGKHLLDWQKPVGLPTGVYFLRLTALGATTCVRVVQQ